jgi:hypothetical protein
VEERHPYYRVSRAGLVVDSFYTGDDSETERERAKGWALEAAERWGRRGERVTVDFLCPYLEDDWLVAAVWDSDVNGLPVKFTPEHRLRLSPLAQRATLPSSATPSVEGLTPELD